MISSIIQAISFGVGDLILSCEGTLDKNGWETLLVHYKSTGMCQNSNHLFIVKDKALNSKILNDCTILFVDRGLSVDVYSLI